MSIVAPGEYSGFQVMGMIEWGQEPKPPKKISWDFQQNPRNSLDQKFAPKKLHAEFLSLRWDAELRGLDTETLPGIFRLFRIPQKSLLKSSHP